jgi:hypothetical protein
VCRDVAGGGANHCVLVIGADFSYRQNFNDLLEVEWMGGDSEMTKEEYAVGRYCHDQLRTETGG